MNVKQVIAISNLFNKKGEIRRVPVPANRVTPLKNNWEKILATIVVHMINSNLLRKT